MMYIFNSLRGSGISTGLIMRAFATAVYLAMHAFAIYLLDQAFIALDYKTALYVTACYTLNDKIVAKGISKMLQRRPRRIRKPSLLYAVG